MPETPQAAEIMTIPCLSDNYAYLLHDPGTGATAVVDVPQIAPIEAALAARDWILSDILITHHHHDHIADVDALRRKTGAKVWGARADAHRLPALDYTVSEGDGVFIGQFRGDVIDVSGHSLGHVAYHFAQAEAVFTGDSLMALGCGRLFEGDAKMMWNSLLKLRALSPDTKIYSGHEYTQTNARFAQTIEPENAALKSRADAIDKLRVHGQPTVPSILSVECETNPFLRADLPLIAAGLGMAGLDAASVFAELRARKDRF